MPPKTKKNTRSKKELSKSLEKGDEVDPKEISSKKKVPPKARSKSTI